MKTQVTLQNIQRLLRNLIRTSVIVETDLDTSRSRTQSVDIITDWLQSLTSALDARYASCVDTLWTLK